MTITATAHCHRCALNIQCDKPASASPLLNSLWDATRHLAQYPDHITTINYTNGRTHATYLLTLITHNPTPPRKEKP